MMIPVQSRVVPVPVLSPELRIEMIATASLLPTENHNPGRVLSLREVIQDQGVWSRPLLVEKTCLVVMDGHHRLRVAQILLLQRIPAVLIGYDDPRLRVTAWDDEAGFDTRRILDAGLLQDLLPYKSTKHMLSVPLPACSVPLADLH